MINCQVCGAPNDDQAVKCAYCGAKIESLKTISDEELLEKAMDYKYGFSVKPDWKKAEAYFEKLAAKGYTVALYELGDMLLKSDRERALHLWKLGAKKGNDMCVKRLEMENVEYATDIPLQDEVLEKTAETKTSNAGGMEYADLIEQALPNIVRIQAWAYSEREVGDIYGDTQVAISSSLSGGSGYIVDGGYVVTNFHVVERSLPYLSGALDLQPPSDYPFKAYFEPSISEETYFLELVGFSQENDIAVLRFKNPLIANKYARRKNLSFNTEPLRYGQEVYTIGNPLGLGISAISGHVACPCRKRAEWEAMGARGVNIAEAIQVTFPVNHGNSGGALLNKNNEVVGMTTFGVSELKGGTDMCVPAKYIKAVMDEVMAQEE